MFVKVQDESIEKSRIVPAAAVVIYKCLPFASGDACQAPVAAKVVGDVRVRVPSAPIVKPEIKFELLLITKRQRVT